MNNQESALWKPKERECYWIINNDLQIYAIVYFDIKSHNDLISAGNYFRTREEAKATAEKIKEVLKNSKLWAIKD